MMLAYLLNLPVEMQTQDLASRPGRTCLMEPMDLQQYQQTAC